MKAFFTWIWIYIKLYKSDHFFLRFIFLLLICLLMILLIEKPLINKINVVKTEIENLDSDSENRILYLKKISKNKLKSLSVSGIDDIDYLTDIGIIDSSSVIYYYGGIGKSSVLYLGNPSISYFKDYYSKIEIDSLYSHLKNHQTSVIPYVLNKLILTNSNTNFSSFFQRKKIGINYSWNNYKCSIIEKKISDVFKTNSIELNKVTLLPSETCKSLKNIFPRIDYIFPRSIERVYSYFYDNESFFNRDLINYRMEKFIEYSETDSMIIDVTTNIDEIFSYERSYDETSYDVLYIVYIEDLFDLNLNEELLSHSFLANIAITKNPKIFKLLKDVWYQGFNFNIAKLIQLENKIDNLNNAFYESINSFILYDLLVGSVIIFFLLSLLKLYKYDKIDKRDSKKNCTMHITIFFLLPPLILLLSVFAFSIKSIGIQLSLILLVGKVLMLIGAYLFINYDIVFNINSKANGG